MYYFHSCFFFLFSFIHSFLHSFLTGSSGWGSRGAYGKTLQQMGPATWQFWAIVHSLVFIKPVLPLATTALTAFHGTMKDSLQRSALPGHMGIHTSYNFEVHCIFRTFTVWYINLCHLQKLNSRLNMHIHHSNFHYKTVVKKIQAFKQVNLLKWSQVSKRKNKKIFI